MYSLMSVIFVLIPIGNVVSAEEKERSSGARALPDVCYPPVLSDTMYILLWKAASHK